MKLEVINNNLMKASQIDLSDSERKFIDAFVKKLANNNVSQHDFNKLHCIVNKGYKSKPATTRLVTKILNANIERDEKRIIKERNIEHSNRVAQDIINLLDNKGK